MMIVVPDDDVDRELIPVLRRILARRDISKLKYFRPVAERWLKKNDR